MSDFTIYNNIPRIMPAPAGLQQHQPESGKDKSFGGLLKDALKEVSDVEMHSQKELGKFLNGESDLHSVMIALEKADLSFQMMMQVRNKFVQAYQEIMRSQV
jgi:flagellar hook-basal body complex protein FliE